MSESGGEIKPKTMSQLLEEVVRVYRSNFGPLVTIFALVQVPLILFQEVVGRLMPDSPAGGAPFGAGDVFLGLVFLGAWVLGTGLMVGALSVALATQYIQPRIEVRTAYEAAWRRLGSMVGALLLVMLIAGGLALPFFGVMLTALGDGQVPGAATGFLILGLPLLGLGVYLFISWSMAGYAAVLEGKTPRPSLGRSRELVRGQWWRVFGIFLVLLLVVGGIGASTNAILNVILQGFLAELAQILVSLVLEPIIYVGWFVLYTDLRARKEGYAFLTMAQELRVVLRGSA
ncbi:MAG: hypothetical protein HY687_06980 [Chloroflexi bacterium]|nr:hypothetical protein [Chloroflexota bacterium]